METLAETMLSFRLSSLSSLVVLLMDQSNVILPSAWPAAGILFHLDFLLSLFYFTLLSSLA